MPRASPRDRCGPCRTWQHAAARVPRSSTARLLTCGTRGSSRPSPGRGESQPVGPSPPSASRSRCHSCECSCGKPRPGLRARCSRRVTPGRQVHGVEVDDLAGGRPWLRPPVPVAGDQGHGNLRWHLGRQRPWRAPPDVFQSATPIMRQYSHRSQLIRNRCRLISAVATQLLPCHRVVAAGERGLVTSWMKCLSRKNILLLGDDRLVT